ncbi:MAG: S8 family serine peptidase [Caldilineaceae bacterium]
MANLALADPGDVVAMIVQTEDDHQTQALIEAAGGQVTAHFPLISSLAAAAPAAVVNDLAAVTSVQWVALDAPVMTMDEQTLAAADDFTTVAYNGADGNYAWSGDWQELGESDGAALGDVAVTPFWGGALQGLRLQGASKGIMRGVNLSTATGAQLQLTYRRKAFASPTDFVRVELSADGGVTWHEVGRLSGPGTDAALQSVAFDLAPYRAAHTMVRLTTAPNLAPTAKFYIDIVKVTLIPDIVDQAATANALYLPLVANGATGSKQDPAAAPIHKADLLARAQGALSDQCEWHCLDLAGLASTFLKVIGADQLWNTAPYLRGQGVTVAVVDSGIADHPDLYDYAGESRVIKHVNFVPDGMLPDDYYGHGTHVAGTIAGLGQASAGAYLGVAPEAQLIDVRVMNDRGHGNTSDVLTGLQWVYDNRITYGIDVVNLSLNSRIPESYQQSALNAALEVLWFNNMVVVVSAGNSGKQKIYPPANDPFVLTVGSANDQGTTQVDDDTLSTFSAYGLTADGFLKPDLVAPGANIVSLLASDDSNLLASFPNNIVVAPNKSIYFKMSGTSMASAVTAGAVAVLLEDEPLLTPDQVKYRLLATARPFAGPESCAVGAGYLDLNAAVHGTTTASANTGIEASTLLWDGLATTLWGSVSWNSVSWNSVSWNSVSWNSVSWNSISWNSISWNSNDNGQGSNSGGGNSCISAIAGLTLVNDSTGEDVQPLYDGAVVNLDAIGATNLSVRADVAGQVESVQFELTGSNGITQVQNAAPYIFAAYPDAATADATAAPTGAPVADSSTGALLGIGLYELKVKTYTQDNSSGTEGGQMQLEFVVAGATRCEVENLVRPTLDLMPITLRVHNQSGATVELLALDADGQRISYGTIAPNEIRSQTTYATHPWLLASTTDHACLYLLPDAGDEPEVVFTGYDNAVTAETLYSYDSSYMMTATPAPTPTPSATGAVYGSTPTPTSTPTTSTSYTMMTPPPTGTPSY